ncbi:MAG: hypothetical protein ACO36A_04030 [Ilumatobacteraceae bacterium]
MTRTHDPGHPLYLDEADARAELARVTDVCLSCRACVGMCGVFGVLFEVGDRRGEGGLFVPDEQDRMVPGCIDCGLCAASCPHTDGPAGVDMPRTMGRTRAMLRATGQWGAGRRWAAFLARRRGIGAV